MAQLTHPARDNWGAYAFVIEQNDSRALDADPLIARLDELASWGMDESRDRACGEFDQAAHVDEIRGSRGIGEPAMRLPCPYEDRAACSRKPSGAQTKV